MRLVLIRHGDSEHSRRGTIAGVSGCSGLTDLGFAQVQMLTDRLAETGELADCAVLLSSPVLRARQTASMVAQVLPVDKVEEDCNLCELHPGEADGLTWEAYRSQFGEFDLVASPAQAFSPGGESWTDFLSRVRRTLVRLAERFDGRTVVAVSHAGFIVATVLALFDIPRPGTNARLDPVHVSLTEWRALEASWQLVSYNDAFHVRPRRLHP